MLKDINVTQYSQWAIQKQQRYTSGENFCWFNLWCILSYSHTYRTSTVVLHPFRPLIFPITFCSLPLRRVLPFLSIHIWVWTQRPTYLNLRNFDHHKMAEDDAKSSGYEEKVTLNKLILWNGPTNILSSTYFLVSSSSLFRSNTWVQSPNLWHQNQQLKSCIN